SFYPADPVALGTAIDTMTGGRTPPREPIARAIMVPHAGYIYSGRIASETYLSSRLPERLVVLGPNHTGEGSSIAIMTGGGRGRREDAAGRRDERRRAGRRRPRPLPRGARRRHRAPPRALHRGPDPVPAASHPGVPIRPDLHRHTATRGPPGSGARPRGGDPGRRRILPDGAEQRHVALCPRRVRRAPGSQGARADRGA